MLNRSFGQKCRHCGATSKAEVCESCGQDATFYRPGIFVENRWTPAPDELAVSFMSRNLKGLFSKDLKVPPGMRAWLLQENQEEQELKEGDYTVEALFDRLNSLFRGNYAEILLVQQGKLPVKFQFDDIPSADLLAVTVDTTLMIGVGDLAAFRRQFMARPGVVSIAHLHRLLNEVVRQALLEIIGVRHLSEMAAHGGVRREVDAELKRKLSHRLHNYGLAMGDADTLSIRHDRFDSQKQLQGSLWLDAEQQRQRDAHDKALNEIYDAREWERIRTREAELRRRRRTAELSEEDAAFEQVLRLRDIETYQAVLDAETRKEAIQAAGQAEVEELVQDATLRRRQREQELLRGSRREESEEEQWRHTRELARIRYEAEGRAAKRDADAREELDAERFANELEKIRIRASVEQARLNDDETARLAALKAEAENLMKAHLRENAIRDARHQAAVAEIEEAVELKAMSAAREETWQDQVLAEKIAKSKEELEAALRAGRFDGAERLIKLDELAQRSRQTLELEKRRGDGEAAEQREDRALERRLREKAADRNAEHQARMDDISRMNVLSATPVEALVAMADSATKIEALLKMSTVKQLSGGALTAEQMREVVAVLHGHAEQPPAAVAASGAGAHAEINRLQEVRVSEQRAIHEANITRIMEAFKLGAGTGQPSPAQAAAGPAPAAGPVHITLNASVYGPRVCPKDGCGTINRPQERRCEKCGSVL